MKKNICTIPNLLSFSRIFLSIVIYYVLSHNEKFILIFLIAIAGLTDAFDGFIARKLKQVTTFGAKLDSIADFTFYTSFLIWFWIKYYSIWPFYFHWSIVPSALIIITYLITFFRFKEFASFHLYSMKFSAVMAYFAVINSVFFGFNELVIKIALIVWSIAAFETLAASIIIKKIKYNARSIVFLK